MSKAVTKLVLAPLVAIAFSTAASAQGLEPIPLLRDLPPDATTIALYFKENVYDSADQRIGRIVDLVIKRDGAVPAPIVSGGGFLGLASKYVAGLFVALQGTQQE